MSGLRVASTYKDFLLGRTRPFRPERDTGPAWLDDDPPEWAWRKEPVPLAKETNR